METAFSMFEYEMCGLCSADFINETLFSSMMRSDQYTLYVKLAFYSPQSSS